MSWCFYVWLCQSDVTEPTLWPAESSSTSQSVQCLVCAPQTWTSLKWFQMSQTCTFYWTGKLRNLKKNKKNMGGCGDEGSSFLPESSSLPYFTAVRSQSPGHMKLRSAGSSLSHHSLSRLLSDTRDYVKHLLKESKMCFYLVSNMHSLLFFFKNIVAHHTVQVVPDGENHHHITVYVQQLGCGIFYYNKTWRLL